MGMSGARVLTMNVEWGVGTGEGRRKNGEVAVEGGVAVTGMSGGEIGEVVM